MKYLGAILVADDDPSCLKMALELLRKEGYECDEAKDAHEAARALSVKQYDLLVSDVEMPGNENLRLIREVPQIAAGLPIILMTAYPTVDSAIQSIQLPVTAYLVKPFDSVQLLTEAARAVRKYQAYRAVRSTHQRAEEWNRALERIESGLRNPKGADVAPWPALLDLTLSNVTHSLADLRVFTEILCRQEGLERRLELMDSTRPLEMFKALKETITVLEKTRSSFKSKELGMLRKRLQSLVEAESPSRKNAGAKASD